MSDNTKNSQVSGFVPDDYEGIEAHYTQVTEIPSLGHCRLVRAMRYGRWHVLKGLKEEYSADVAHTQRLRKELEMMMRMSHPNIAQVYGMERNCDDPKVGMDSFILMEWVDGVTLDIWLASDPNPSLRRRVAHELIDAVGYMHRQGVVHRDIKPDNIMVTHNGSNVKIIDFGLADNDSYAVFKNPAGTEQFIAPEQMNATVADSRNDIYSLGVVLGMMHLGGPYTKVVKKCLLPINERYQTIDQISEDIEKQQRNRRWIRASALAIGVSLVSAAILLGLGYAGRQKLESPSGRYVFRDDWKEGFVYTNWDNANSNRVTAQYQGTKTKSVILEREKRFDGRTWVVAEVGFGCFRDHDELEHITVDMAKFGVQAHSFKGCKRLKSITMPHLEIPPGIGCGGWVTVIDSIFEPYHYDQVTLYVPNVEAMRRDTSWCRFKHIKKYRGPK